VTVCPVQGSAFHPPPTRTSSSCLHRFSECLVVSVVTVPTTLFLLRSHSKYPTCASRVNLWCLLVAWTLWPAKAAAMHGPLVSDRALGTEVSACLRRAVLSSWQVEWDSALGNKLCIVKPSVQEWQSSFRVVRRDEFTLTHLRMSHTPGTRTLVTKGADASLYTLWWYVSWCTALVTPKPAAFVTLTA
jgi:hypothetical protein